MRKKNPHRTKEEDFMKKGLNVLVLLLLASLLFAAGRPEAKVESVTDDFTGKTVTLLIHPTLYKAAGGDEGIKKEFEAETGATVQVVLAPSPEHIEKSELWAVKMTPFAF